MMRKDTLSLLTRQHASLDGQPNNLGDRIVSTTVEARSLSGELPRQWGIIMNIKSTGTSRGWTHNQCHANRDDYVASCSDPQPDLERWVINEGSEQGWKPSY